MLVSYIKNTKVRSVAEAAPEAWGVEALDRNCRPNHIAPDPYGSVCG